MNLTFSRCLTAASVVALAGVMAQAQVVPSEIVPANNSVVEILDGSHGIKLVYDYEVYYASSFIAVQIDVTDAAGNKVTTATMRYTGGWLPDYSGVEESMTIYPDMVLNTPGTYNFVIPANTIKNTATDEVNEAFTLTYTIGAASGPTVSYAAPISIEPANGSVITSLKGIALTYEGELGLIPEAWENPELAQAQLIDGEGNVVEMMDIYEQFTPALGTTVLSMNPMHNISTPDYYTVVIPKGVFVNPDQTVYNDALTLSYIVEAPVANAMNVTKVQPSTSEPLVGIGAGDIKVFFDKYPGLVSWTNADRFLPLIDTNTGKTVCELYVNPVTLDASNYYVNFTMDSDLITPGTYSLTIPAGMICYDEDTSIVNKELTYTWTIKDSGSQGPGDDTNLEYTLEFIKVVNPAQIALGGTYDYAALGGAIDMVMTSWDIVNLKANPSAKPYFEDANGNRYVATGVREFSGDGLITFNATETGEWLTGQYTLYIPRNTFGSEAWAESGYTEGVCNDEVIIPFNYIQNPAIDNTDNDFALELSKFGWYSTSGTCLVNYLDKPERSPNIKGGSVLVIGSNKNSMCMDVYVNIIDQTTGETLWTAGTYRQATTSVDNIITINGKNAQGEFELPLADIFNLEFLVDHEYVTEVGFYKQFDGIPDAQRIKYDQANAYYKGTSVGYQYADVDILNVSVPEGGQFDDPNNGSVTITFSKPVTMDEKYTYAYSGRQGKEAYSSITSNEDGTQWTLTASPSTLNGCTGSIDFRFAPRCDGYSFGSDQYYTSGEKEFRYITISYYCFLGGKELAVVPASESVVEELYNFTFTAPTAIGKNIGFQGVSPTGKLLQAELKNAAGEVVATIDRNDHTATTRGEYNIDCQMHLDQVVNKPGTYTLFVPGAFFMTGTQENSVANKPMQFTYTIEGEIVEPNDDYVTVNYWIEDYAGLAVKALKGEEMTLTVDGSDDWSLSELILNGTDVKADVTANGLYTIGASVMEDNVVLKAAFEFAHEIDFVFTTGVSTVEGCAYSVSTDGEYLVINGLNLGDNVKVYSLNGMTLFNNNATADCAKISLPNGTYIVMINNTVLKVQK